MIEGKASGESDRVGQPDIGPPAGDVATWTPLLGLVLDGRGGGAAHVVPALPYDIVSRRIEIDGHGFDIQVIHWEGNAPGIASNLYLRNGQGQLVHKTESPLRERPHFQTTVCASSPWADRFTPEADPLHPDSPSPDSPTWAKLLIELSELGDAIYAAFIPKKAEQAVLSYERNGFFPTYEELDDEEKAWRHQHAREMVRQIYIAEPRLFLGSSGRQAKVLIRLLDRLAVSNENEALMDVLQGALELDAASTAKLASHLRRASMENIVSSIEALQRRDAAVQQLRHLMTAHYRDVLESPDLQHIIESNTWLFGPRYETIGAEDDSFTKIVKTLRDDLLAQGVPEIDEVDSPADLPGAKRQADLFLARKFPTFDSFGRQIYKCIVIEIKRPTLSLNRKHLRQLEDYAEIIRNVPEFQSECMHFELILVGRQFSPRDGLIRSRLNSVMARGEMGLVSDDPRIKLFVMNWFSLLDSFELTNSFMLEKLRLKRAELGQRTKSELVAELQEAC